MFTGLVEATSEILLLEKTAGGARLHLERPEAWTELEIGESVAVNGCCLTVADATEAICFDLLDETLARTNLGALPEHALVNLERALAANGRFGGHFVQGHIDGVGEILALEKNGADHRLEVSLPAAYRSYLVEKGSIALDGISLTVAAAGDDRFTVWIIPHTMQVTNLHQRRVGDPMNLEFDLIAKYVERLLAAREGKWIA